MRILDARMLPPGYQGPRDIVAEFRAGHLPGAVFFDIEALSDSASSLPHMLTSPAQFARYMGALGVSDAQHCVIYDDCSLFSAPRAWWMLQSSGVQQVSLLAVCLDAWSRAGGPLEEGPPTPAPQTFTPRIAANRGRALDDIRRISVERSAQIIDARPAARLRGEAPEPRLGLLRGHIPGSLNLPWDQLVQNGQLKPLPRLEEQIRQAGIDSKRPIVASCGSGVTAAVVVLALTALGAQESACMTVRGANGAPATIRLSPARVLRWQNAGHFHMTVHRRTTVAAVAMAFSRKRTGRGIGIPRPARPPTPPYDGAPAFTDRSQLPQRRS